MGPKHNDATVKAFVAALTARDIAAEGLAVNSPVEAAKLDSAVASFKPDALLVMRLAVRDVYGASTTSSEFHLSLSEPGQTEHYLWRAKASRSHRRWGILPGVSLAEANESFAEDVVDTMLEEGLLAAATGGRR